MIRANDSCLEGGGGEAMAKIKTGNWRGETDRLEQVKENIH